MYKVKVRFADLTDKNYVYEIGDTYPREGFEVSEERIFELTGSNNKIGKAVIEEIIKPAKKKKTEE